MKNSDLHSHSYYSDGEMSPKELVKIAKRKKIKYLALTDHNSVDGIDEAINEGEKQNVKIIPGVEVTTYDGEVLGYFIDYKNNNFKCELKNFRIYGNEKVKRIIKNLNNLGYDINIKKFNSYFKHSINNYNTWHIHEFLRKNFNIPDEKSREIVKCAKNIKQPYRNLNLYDSVKFIKKYKGVPVLAHPWFNNFNFNEKNLKKLIKAGLIGIEIDNGEGYNFGRTLKYVKKIKSLAKKYNLILTSGSDYHGEYLTKLLDCHKIGKYNCDETVVDKLFLVSLMNRSEK